MQRLCVFCGSNVGNQPIYADQARRLGEELGARGIDLVYGGGHIGLMGILADAVLKTGGKVIGVIPQSLKDKELAHAGLTELHVVRHDASAQGAHGRFIRWLRGFARGIWHRR